MRISFARPASFYIAKQANKAVHNIIRTARCAHNIEQLVIAVIKNTQSYFTRLIDKSRNYR